MCLSVAAKKVDMWLRILCAVLMVSFFIAEAPAQTTKSSKATAATANKNTAAGPRDFRSKNFVIHTDLSDEDAQELLGRLENMVKLISTYWGRPCRQVIECYVVKDLANWPQGSIEPEGLRSIRDGAGVTRTTVRTNGVNFQAKSIVYAVADRGTPQHEAVHAYCGQTFGTTGPLWYSEGMAEMGQYWKENNSSVNCHPAVVEYIHNTEPKSLNAIVNAEEVTGDSWENYAWRWALCHVLATNPNYAPRFRPLGIGMLTGQKVSFESVYGTMAKEISFEYLFFLQHFDLGYRADLCAWDWKAKFKPLLGAVPITSKIKAKGGWQPTLVTVKSGTQYDFMADGKWRTSKDSDEVSADGADDGRGKLVGVIFDPDGYVLGEPFDLGAFGDWTAPDDGQLFVRANQPWKEIDDEDSGTVTFKIKPTGKGQPFVDPRRPGASSPGARSGNP